MLSVWKEHGNASNRYEIWCVADNQVPSHGPNLFSIMAPHLQLVTEETLIHVAGDTSSGPGIQRSQILQHSSSYQIHQNPENKTQVSHSFQIAKISF